MAIEFSKGELFELGDAVSAMLLKLLASGDPEHYEAKYGSASNLLSALEKITLENLGMRPDWMTEMEQQVTALRDSQKQSADARESISEFVRQEERLTKLGFIRDAVAAKDGIRD